MPVARARALSEAVCLPFSSWVKKCPNLMTEDSDVESRPFIDGAELPGEYTPALLSRLE